MRPASTNPDDERARDDLGRFGWGMKSASLSQCRLLTVVTQHGDLGISGLAREVGPDPDNDHPMAPLRNSECLGAHDEVRRLCRLLQAGLAILDPDGAQFVLMAVARAE